MPLIKNRKEYEIASRLGDVGGVSPLTILGHSDAVGTNLRVLHHQTNTMDLGIDALLATPATVTISSTSANDVLTSGSGAWTVQLAGINSAGDFVTENLNLTGQSAVTSVNTYQFIFSTTVIAAGATGSNAGILYVGTGTVTTGVPAVVNCSAEIGTNLSRVCAYMVPNNKALVLNQILCFSGDTNKTLNFQFLQRPAATGLWLEAFDVHTEQAEIDFSVQSYPPLAAGDVVAVKADVNTGTAFVTIAVSGDLVDI